MKLLVLVVISAAHRRLCKPPTSSVIADAQRRLCKPPTSSMITGAQRRLCKPPTSNEIVEVQRRLYQSPTRRFWEYKDGLLYAWRYTYILMRKCGVHRVACTISALDVLCGVLDTVVVSC